MAKTIREIQISNLRQCNWKIPSESRKGCISQHERWQCITNSLHNTSGTSTAASLAAFSSCFLWRSSCHINHLHSTNKLDTAVSGHNSLSPPDTKISKVMQKVDKKLSYHQETARHTRAAIRIIQFEKACNRWMTLKITQDHLNCRYSMSLASKVYFRDLTEAPTFLIGSRDHDRTTFRGVVIPCQDLIYPISTQNLITLASAIPEVWLGAPENFNRSLDLDYTSPRRGLSSIVRNRCNQPH